MMRKYIDIVNATKFSEVKSSTPKPRLDEMPRRRGHLPGRDLPAADTSARLGAAFNRFRGVEDGRGGPPTIDGEYTDADRRMLPGRQRALPGGEQPDLPPARGPTIDAEDDF